MRARVAAGRIAGALAQGSKYRVDGGTPDRVTYTLLIRACTMEGQLETGLSLIDEMRGLGIPPYVGDYNVCLAACGRQENPERAVKMCQELCHNMRGHGVEPNVITYNAIMSTWEKRDQPQRVRESQHGRMAALEALTLCLRADYPGALAHYGATWIAQLGEFLFRKNHQTISRAHSY